METPKLTKEAEEQAFQLLEKFKTDMVKMAENVISDLYCDIIPFIESDSWCNFRNEVMAGFKDYNNKAKAEFDFKAIRQQILKENRAEIIHDLNQDLVKENEQLKKEINQMADIYNQIHH